MPTVNGISITPNSSLSWTSSNLTVVSEFQGLYAFLTENNGGGYNKISYAEVAGAGSSGGFMSVNFSLANGYAYVGLTQSLMSTSDSVAQGTSKIDVGVKLDGTGVLLTVNGAESVPLGDNKPIYAIVCDGSSGFVILKGNKPVYIVKKTDVSAFDSTSPLKAAIVAYSPQMQFFVEGGSFSGTSSLDIGSNGFLDTISSSSSYTLSIPSGVMTVAIPLAAGESAAYSYEVVDPLTDSVLSTITNPTISPSSVSLSLTDTSLIGQDIVITKITSSGYRSLPFGITNKTITSQNVLSYGIDTGAGYYSAGYKLNDSQYSGITHVAHIPVNQYSSIAGKTELNAATDPISILPLYDGIFRLGITPGGALRVIPGTVSQQDILDISQSADEFTIDTSGFTETFPLKSFASLTPSTFNVGNDCIITLSWGNTASSKVAVFTSQSASENFYSQTDLSNLSGYTTTLDVSNDTITFKPSDGTYYFYPVDISQTGNVAVVGLGSSLSLQATGGGGGGGGGGGNNGGSGHNNMAALEYRYPDWSVDVSQDQTITVLGEESGALTADEVIVINVPLTQFKQCLAYKSTWDASLVGTEAGSQPLPEVALRLAVQSGAAKAEIDGMFTKLKGSPTGALSTRTMTDDASASHDCFSKRLSDGSITFANSVFDSQDLPKVAIRSISEGAITAEELSTTLSKVTTANASHKAYLEGLFEQAVAEGRVKKDDTVSDEGAEWKAPSFVVGDSLSVLVKYNFKQRRLYEVDGLDAAGGNSDAKALTLTIGGHTFDIPVGDDVEESEDKAENSRTYEFKLVAIA